MTGLRFEETMSGSLLPADGGAEHPFSFTVEARARKLRHLALGGPLDLSGHVTLGGSVSRAPVAGSLLVDPIFGRRLVYELYWRDAEDRPNRFYGRKDLRALALVRTMTLLRGKVYRQGQLVGDATLTFDLRDLAAFLLSMRPRLAER